ncbi:hypothetical protein M3G03_05300 [Aestuariimicrobium sp. p3-SID1156]|uniref:hypothetical protein n=1 Tax=Aestuariimicrobium sp. p3-SID1156 TaxID=2916038 RepID=UPI00223A8D46|nr:hypothetical protein [Aestuariimicrobium sp. p3-SID1156]MCT1458958.1 hypothetical protein [Aestuariimicrobium sp. p3-SID1156]
MRIDVTSWVVDRVEATGSTESLWLLEPDIGDRTVRWLHKDVKVHAWGSQGEDWAEVISTAIGRGMKVPCAETRLCIRGGRMGSLSRSLKEPGYTFNDGGLALEEAHAPGYVRQTDTHKAVDPQRPNVLRPGHNLRNIFETLQAYSPPHGFEGPAGSSAFDVFAGMMLLDAIIANQDRHEQNWAVLRAELFGKPDMLAGSFDHGGSLAYNLQDTRRVSLMAKTGGIRDFAEKGRANRFEHSTVGGASTLTAHAAEALAMCNPDIQRWWKDRLVELDLGPLRERLATGVVGVSSVALDFSMSLAEVNVERLRRALYCA